MRKAFAANKQNTVPCRACYRPCSDKEDIYCKDCIASGDAVWHTNMIGNWQAEVEAKEEAKQ